MFTVMVRRLTMGRLKDLNVAIAFLQGMKEVAGVVAQHHIDIAIDSMQFEIDVNSNHEDIGLEW